MDDNEDTPKVFVIDRKCDQKGMRVTNFDKWIIALIIAVVFFIFSLPFLYKLTNSGTKLFKLNAINNTGCPTIFGIILHTIVFLVVVRLLMH